MASITAGAKLHASDLNNNLPRIARCTATVSATSDTTLDNVTGMVLSLEANAVYALDAYIAYTAGETGDLKVAWTVPSGTTGHWAVWGLGVGATGSTVGDANGARPDGFGDANFLSVGGANTDGGRVACHPRGYVVVAGTAGNLQLRFAQNTSNGTATTVVAGSWMRLTRIV